MDQNYFGLSELSTNILLWQSSKNPFPHNLWVEAYQVLQKQGTRLTFKFPGLDIEDVVQDVAVVIPRIAKSYEARGHAEFSTVLGSALRYASRDYLRRKKTQGTHKPYLEKYIEKLAMKRIPSVIEQVEFNETLGQMNAAMATLPEEERSMLCLAINKTRYSDIAKMFSVTIDSVKCKVYRARLHFKEALKAYNPPAEHNYIEEPQALPMYKPIKKGARSYEAKKHFATEIAVSEAGKFSTNLQNAIDSLPAVQSEIVRLRVSEKLSETEIALHLSISIEKVKQIYRRAKERLFRKVDLATSLEFIEAA